MDYVYKPPENSFFEIIISFLLLVVFAPFTTPIAWLKYFSDKHDDDSKIEFLDIICLLMSVLSIILWLLIVGGIYAIATL